jgi:hypothetical protein
MCDSEEDVLHHPKEVGKINDRRFRSEMQPPTPNILDIDRRSDSSSSRCLQTDVVKEGYVPLLCVEANTPSNKDDPETTTTQGSAGDTVFHSQFWYPMILEMRHLQPPYFGKSTKNGL